MKKLIKSIKNDCCLLTDAIFHESPYVTFLLVSYDDLDRQYKVRIKHHYGTHKVLNLENTINNIIIFNERINIV